MSIDGLSAPPASALPPSLSPAPGVPASALPEESGVAREARELVAGLLAVPWGQVSASPYETGRVVSLAPWLAGHAERVGFLLAGQRPDGGWGAPGGYGLVPTLSAVEALLAECRRESPCADPGLLAAAAGRGLAAVRGWEAAGPGAALPDMPAIELIVPSLLSLIDGHLDGRGPLQGVSGAKLAAVRTWLASGAAIPQKLVHALEVAGGEAIAVSGVVPTPMPGGMAAVGASPGASAAWLAVPPEPAGGAAGGAAPRGTGRSSREGTPVQRYLEAVVAASGGPVPCTVPITVFERGWTVSWLLRAGIAVDVPPELAASLRDGLGPEGVAAGPGLPADADTTSVALYALALLGEPREPEGLWPFETEDHFCTWRGEEGMSLTTNAHVLDAFGEYVRRCGGEPRHAAVTAKLASWLRGRQQARGSWMDRWHVSPYYATACCAIALSEFGGEESEEAVGRAVDWVLGTQRRDGSWGRWEGTAEETAYALQTLLLAGAVRGGRWREAVERGRRHLLAGHDHGAPLWVDKDLYLPVAIVRAAVLGALHLAERTMNLTGG
ncbi:prenyltransferase/squalene oxidase repeat-containing protein [Streptosporangium minutum]|uniref:prenyltransferase/squalene oxidase repeat-containing protein n=1 Tax=Streptosporangium minutum TaxID=569862 RepID=UPI000A399A71|nr:prenyltransferase/squalene oxidase repeat-containing protein [Streptosporangium minutum]